MSLTTNIKNCTLCKQHLPLGPRPVFSFSESSKIAIIGQAPGTKVHASGIPWDDQSGKMLRQWLGVSDEEFYNSDHFAIVPMGFCYPGKGKSGDLPPRPECAEKWHKSIFESANKIQLYLLIGQYAQKYYLQQKMKRNLTETVQNYHEYLPKYLPLPHPSPRNRFWLAKNPWFKEDVLPLLKKQVDQILH